MRKSIELTAVALGLALGCGLQAQDAPNPGMPGPGMPNPGMPNPEPGDNFRKNLFEPEMIMGCQGELKLSDEQSQAIKSILSTTRAELMGLEWDLNQAVAALGKALSPAQVDENAALAQLDKVLDLERNIKRNTLKMSIQLKNKLTPEQQEILSHKREQKPMSRRPWQQMQQGRPGFEGPMQQGRPGFDGPMPFQGRPGGPGGEGFMPRQGRPGGEGPGGSGEGPMPPQGRPGDGPGGDGPPPPQGRAGGEGPQPPQGGPGGEPLAPPKQ
jgi:Spy/CpxP family protein refolding chaperone